MKKISIIRLFLSIAPLLFLLFLAPAQVAAQATADQQRVQLQQMRADVLKQLFADLDDSRQILENAQGYAIFSNTRVNLLMFSTVTGGGILRDHRDGSDTYMKVF